MRLELLCEAIGAKRRAAMIQTITDYYKSINVNSPEMAEKSVEAAIKADPTNGIRPGVVEWILMHARPWEGDKDRSPEQVKRILVLYEKVKKTKSWKALKTDGVKFFNWPKPHDPYLDQLHVRPSHAVFHDDLLQYDTSDRSTYDYITLVATVYCAIYEEGFAEQRQQQSQAVAEKGTKTIFSDGTYKIIRMTTPEAVQHWTADGGWCVKKEYYAKTYLKDGDLYLIYQNNKRWMLVTFTEKDTTRNFIELRNTSNMYPSSKEAYLIGKTFRKAGLLASRYLKAKTKADRNIELNSTRAVYQRCLKWTSWDEVVRNSTDATTQSHPGKQGEELDEAVQKGLDLAATTIIDAAFLAGNMGWQEPEHDIRPDVAAPAIE